MDPVTLFATSVAGSMLANFGTAAVERFFRKAAELKPSLKAEIQSAQTSQDLERIFSEAVGVIDANAGTGSVDIDGALLEAIRGARFDHAHGTVDIANSRVSAPVLVTGGGIGATGQTLVGGNTSLKSQGTEIKVGKGASIKITGNASIKQT
jgi:hypothetical protein